jgi:hypothetical protein
MNSGFKPNFRCGKQTRLGSLVAELLVLQNVFRRFVPTIQTKRAVTFLSVNRVFLASVGFPVAFDAELPSAGIVRGVPRFMVALVHCVAVSAGPSIHKIGEQGSDGNGN